jgi:type IV fimbrial biogenesis protein FimT
VLIMKKSILQRGFSMIEIAISLTLVALLLFAVMPDVTAMAANNRIRSGAESYLQGMQRARNEALRSNQVVTFWLTTPNASGVLDNTCALDSGARAWVVSVNDPSTKCATASSATADPMIFERAVGASTAGTVTVSALQSDGTTAATSVAFDGFGRVTAGTAISTIDLNNATTGNNFRPLRIQVARGGSVRLCEPRVTDTTDPRRC